MSETITSDEESLRNDYEALFGNNSRIFSEENKLSKNYVPKKILARDKQIVDIATNLRPIMQMSSPGNIYIWGEKGVGKSSCMEYVLNTLVYGAKIKNKKILIDFFTINCATLTTDTAVCLTILSRFSSEFKYVVTKGVSKRGQSIDYYKAKIWEYINEKASQCDIYAFVIFFDEIDKWNTHKRKVVTDETAQINLLYDFTRAIENKNIRPENRNKCFIATIAASNQMEFLSTLEGSIRSSAGFDYINFPNYKPEDLYKILFDRKDTFLPGVISDELIWYVAESVATKYNGDARRALDMLNMAGRIAENNMQDTITLENILEADKKIVETATTDMIMDFSLHDKFLFTAIYLCHQASVPASTGLVYQLFCELCRMTKEDVTSFGHNSRRLTELTELGIILPNKPTGTRGNTRIFKLSTTILSNIDYIYTDELKKKVQEEICDIESIFKSKIKGNQKITLNEYEC